MEQIQLILTVDKLNLDAKGEVSIVRGAAKLIKAEAQCIRGQAIQLPHDSVSISATVLAILPQACAVNVLTQLRFQRQGIGVVSLITVQAIQ
jgi:hypothetical protein